MIAEYISYWDHIKNKIHTYKAVDEIEVIIWMPTQIVEIRIVKKIP